MVSKTISELEPRFGGALDAFIGTSLVVAGNYIPVFSIKILKLYTKRITACDYSGGYFNPVLATSLKLNCPGNTLMEHFVVYWVGSIVGSVASWWVYPLIQKTLIVSTDKKDN